MQRKKFYHEGVLFSCTECGNCCSDPDGEVDLNDHEAHSIAEALKISFESLLQKYVNRDAESGKLTLRSYSNGDCIFLQDDKCMVYQARPLQCRTFPFWPEVMKSAYRWQSTAESCPGMNSGKRFSKQEIDEKLRRMREYQQSLTPKNTTNGD